MPSYAPIKSAPRRHRRSLIVVAAMISLLILCQMATPVEAKKKDRKVKKKNRIKTTKEEKISKWKDAIEELPSSNESVIVDEMEVDEANDKSKSSKSSSKEEDEQAIIDEDATIEGDKSETLSSKKSDKNDNKNDNEEAPDQITIDTNDEDEKSSKSKKSKKSKNKNQPDIEEDSVTPDATTSTDCVQCSDTPSQRMIALGQECSTAPHLSYRCNRRNFVRNLLCAKSCFEAGANDSLNCCADTDVNTDNDIGARGGDEETSAEKVEQNSPQPTTSKPTLPPSVSPTSKVPTKQPTANPTRSTSSPTSSPSKAPTKQPTANPTRSTSSPTSSPSRVPTKKPSVSPTTSSPTSSPTKMHSGQPSVSPTTSSPTSSSTKMHSGQPSTSPSDKPSTSPSAKPSAKPSLSPSTNVEADDNGSCVQCSDEVTPWMKTNTKTCASWPATADRCNTTYWLDNQFCAQTCAENGLAYNGTNCCVEEEDPTPDTNTGCTTCEDIPSTWMTTNGFACSTWKGLKGKCGPEGQTQSFIDNKFCAQSCYERFGISYLDGDGNEERCCEA